MGRENAMPVLVLAVAVRPSRERSAFVRVGKLGPLRNDVDELTVLGAGGVVDARGVGELEEGRGEQRKSEEGGRGPPERKRNRGTQASPSAHTHDGLGYGL